MVGDEGGMMVCPHCKSKEVIIKKPSTTVGKDKLYCKDCHIIWDKEE